MNTVDPNIHTVQLELRGGNWEFWKARERELLLEGPRGTGKTRTILELVDALCREYAGLSVLIVRRYQRSLTGSCLRTYEEQVLPGRGAVASFGGSDTEPAGYRYRNGSRIVTGGMDNPDKIKSSEYDVVYANEATELSEDDWESLLPLLRHLKDGRPVIEAQRIIGDCNPSTSGHWLNQRCEDGKTRRIVSSLWDNPAFYDDVGEITSAGAAYLATLESLTGTRRERWLLGRWTGLENSCYPNFDPRVHVRPLEDGLYFQSTLLGVDYGREHLSAVVALSIDQYGRRWVREAWAESDKDQGHSLTQRVGLFKERYKTRRGRADPNQGYMAGRLGLGLAKSSAGSRLHRIDLMESLFYTFPGGRVPKFSEEMGLRMPQGPFEEPDSPGIFLVEGAPGIAELAGEIEGYHYVYTETARGKTKDVYRENENRIAALEYANEEWEEGVASTPYPRVSQRDDDPRSRRRVEALRQQEQVRRRN